MPRPDKSLNCGLPLQAGDNLAETCDIIKRRMTPPAALCPTGSFSCPQPSCRGASCWWVGPCCCNGPGQFLGSGGLAVFLSSVSCSPRCPGRAGKRSATGDFTRWVSGDADWQVWLPWPAGRSEVTVLSWAELAAQGSGGGGTLLSRGPLWHQGLVLTVTTPSVFPSLIGHQQN